MTIRYASDLHLEFPENREFLKRNPLSRGDVLLLAGDIVPFAIMDEHSDFFSCLSDTFPTTYWIPGNHEYYYSDISDRSGTMNEKIRSNVFLVNNTTVIQNNTKFIFTTLWSYIGAVNQMIIRQRISDFHVIKNKGKLFTVDHFNDLHRVSLNFLDSEIKQAHSGSTLVATHHVPALSNYPAQYKTDVLNEAFAIDLYDRIADSNIDYWIYGHHHVNVDDYTIGKTKMSTNQLGYVRYNENEDYNNNKFINI